MLLLLILAASLQRYLEVISVSDTHGWIYGDRHNASLGDYATLMSYIHHAKNNVSANPDGALLVADAGDLTEGTGLSDVSKIPGEYIIQAAAEIPWDAITVGNHDLYHAATADFLHESVDFLFRGGYVTTNTFVKAQTDTPLGSSIHKYSVLPNGLRVLTFAFMYGGSRFPSVEITPAAQFIRSERMQPILKEYADQVDVLFLVNHIPGTSPEHDEMCAAFRSFFDRQNYKIPIIALGAHTHQVHNFFLRSDNSPGHNDSQYYVVEASHYLLAIQHVTYAFEDIEYDPNGSAGAAGAADTLLKGVRLADVFVRHPVDNVPAGLMARFSLTPDEFYTQQALLLREQILGWVEDFGLNERIGFSKHTYSPRKPVSDPDSLGRLWLLGVCGPDFVDPALAASHTQFPVVGVSSLRSKLYEGDIVMDDLYTVMPFKNLFRYIPTLTADDVRCVIQHMNHRGKDLREQDASAGSDLPRYLTPVEDLDTLRPGIYDLILSDYDAPKFSDVFKKGGACYDPGRDDRNYSHLPYNSALNKELGKTISTQDAMLYYIRHHLNINSRSVQKVSPESEEDYNVRQAWYRSTLLMCFVITLAIYIVSLSIFAVMLLLTRYKRNLLLHKQPEIIVESVETSAEA